MTESFESHMIPGSDAMEAVLQQFVQTEINYHSELQALAFFRGLSIEDRTEEEIDRLYAQLRSIRAAPPSAENEGRYQEALKRLRHLQGEEAARIQRLLDARASIKIGAVDEALRRADELLARH